MIAKSNTKAKKLKESLKNRELEGHIANRCLISIIEKMLDIGDFLLKKCEIRRKTIEKCLRCDIMALMQDFFV
ncbi:MAG: hypothetical protein IK999_00975 [Ruminococcus sp.]|nr:hypothetical protein [Ruminococcus sp.]